MDRIHAGQDLLEELNTIKDKNRILKLVQRKAGQELQIVWNSRTLDAPKSRVDLDLVSFTLRVVNVNFTRRY